MAYGAGSLEKRGPWRTHVLMGTTVSSLRDACQWTMWVPVYCPHPTLLLAGEICMAARRLSGDDHNLVAHAR